MNIVIRHISNQGNATNYFSTAFEWAHVNWANVLQHI